MQQQLWELLILDLKLKFNENSTLVEMLDTWTDVLENRWAKLRCDSHRSTLKSIPSSSAWMD